ncbi:MurR/RpiR family transcriptional regulator [Salisediminibacterium halotolerans]|uniref:DNA-binding transcriptional regulator, MurR/RpiR family, contains HTH and SIS domains n=1 Tax=Salisediminibacterium halotolerans TaxID=517425 RepID=A0A1H9VFM8_9BACI|nr:MULTISPECIES: MurR/RpiR family transcriptional regulator [Salisediminibacterium]RLJ74479.1 RpiR family transcriptional regulator [Actinophytocola xinjiangensis]RPE87428.1 RpiR family transcriptional regulator [Salisediminibacterium halotolerans]TWG35315.1 RpiR family transcriptional regulator [Salisediminibacterium halotolerans]SES20600.1 DNA-binding transcriptional regulator, MurR/RpiR family, contains HTH and SIS domains [Salisediminibacterium haloalkalitolerans]GEL07947.1 N-acetylmannosa
MLESDVLQQIIQSRETMSKSHKKIAGYLIDNHETAPFLTASKLAKHAGVGEATVIRFAYQLGYAGYPDFQRHLQEALQRKMTSAEVLRRTTDEDNDAEDAVTEVLSDDMQNIDNTLKQINTQTFEAAVNEMIQAKRIYIIAYRSAASIGGFLEFYLDLVLQNTEMIHQADGVSEHLLDIDERDLVIGVGFSRYTKRTVEVMKYVKEKRAKTVVISDHMLSPLVPYGDYNLLASTEINSFIDSYAAPMSIAGALITALTRSEHKKIEKRLRELESLWETFDVFYN